MVEVIAAVVMREVGMVKWKWWDGYDVVMVGIMENII